MDSTNARTNYDARNGLEQDFLSALITGVCLHSASAVDIEPLCPVDMLIHDDHKIMFRGLLALERDGVKPTFPLLWEQIVKGKDKDAHEGRCWSVDFGPGTLVEYANSLYGNSEDEIKRLAQGARREGAKFKAQGKLIALGNECEKFGVETGEISQGLQNVIELLDGGMTDLPLDLSDLMRRVVEAAANGENNKPRPTPWESLNRVLRGGFTPGELVVLAARPGMGKTAFAGCVAIEMAKAGIPTLFVSREVKDITIGNRLTARNGRIDMSLFRQNVEDASNVIARIEQSAMSLARYPLSVVEKSIAPMTPREVRRLAKSIKGIGLIVVDYLQLLCPDTPNRSREREVAEMSRSMKQLALDCDCPVLLLSQLNRSVEETGREPVMSDLRESGAIEQDADIVMFLHADKAAREMATMPVKAIVAKGRSSGTGTAFLVFEKPFSNFKEDGNAQMWQRLQQAKEEAKAGAACGEDNGL